MNRKQKPGYRAHLKHMSKEALSLDNHWLSVWANRIYAWAKPFSLWAKRFLGETRYGRNPRIPQVSISMIKSISCPFRESSRLPQYLPYRTDSWTMWHFVTWCRRMRSSPRWYWTREIMSEDVIFIILIFYLSYRRYHPSIKIYKLIMLWSFWLEIPYSSNETKYG